MEQWIYPCLALIAISLSLMQGLRLWRASGFAFYLWMKLLGAVIPASATLLCVLLNRLQPIPWIMLIGIISYWGVEAIGTRMARDRHPERWRVWQSI